jgi:octaprenyl-diphosphate synthase
MLAYAVTESTFAINPALNAPSISAINAAKTPLSADISAIHALIAHDLQQVNDTLKQELNSDVPLIGQIGDYLIAAGGKRLRPMLVLLCGRALDSSAGANSQDVVLAAIIELIHTATLLHDDVVDESSQRRARKTANALWGNAPSVLVGDFLYSRAFQMMVRLSDIRVMHVLANTTNLIAEGEVLQLMHRHNPEVSEARYLDVIRRKTAILFEAACRLAAVTRQQSSETIEALAGYGMALGMAFQIADDVMDFVGDASSIGKNLGDDLAEGKSTLPLIFAAKRGSDAQAMRIREVLEKGERGALTELIAILRETDAIDASFEVAERFASEAIAALNVLPESAEKAALSALARFAVRRLN